MKTFIIVFASMLAGGFLTYMALAEPMAQRITVGPTHQLQVAPIDEHGNVVGESVQAADALPPADLDLKAVIDVLAEYDVVHESRLMTFLGYYGLTDPATKTIYINDREEIGVRRETVLHEFVHAIYMRQGVNTSGPWEPFVDAKAQRVFDVLYGPKK